ncbi:hypothetical protein BpHYR1_012206 [Brachionus plicatilis]|uniref:Retrotransposon gag domain-containing protein n=1 Tax=Brachionus plicatilis TaxID=10195 RepID=A0A3M7REG0_BRAPC|nr:hypothetical protein BpHYR1_012206 [Brachionus plicatilis]
MKIEEDSFRNINQSKQCKEGAKSTLQEIATSLKTLIHEDVLQENVGFGLSETRIINFKVDDIPKLYGKDRDIVDEWIYLVQTEARTQGIIRSRLIDCVTKLLRGNALQMLRNMQKRDESFTWEKFKNQLLATLKPADVQRGLRSELKSIELMSNFEDNIMKFQTIANKIDKIDEFELVWFFFEPLDPRVRADKVVYLEASEKEYCNKVITENLTDENYPDDCISEDLNNFNEDWPLELLTRKIEL